MQCHSFFDICQSIFVAPQRYVHEYDRCFRIVFFFLTISSIPISQYGTYFKASYVAFRKSIFVQVYKAAVESTIEQLRIALNKKRVEKEKKWGLRDDNGDPIYLKPDDVTNNGLERYKGQLVRLRDTLKKALVLEKSMQGNIHHESVYISGLALANTYRMMGEKQKAQETISGLYDYALESTIKSEILKLNECLLMRERHVEAKQTLLGELDDHFPCFEGFVLKDNIPLFLSDSLRHVARQEDRQRSNMSEGIVVYPNPSEGNFEIRFTSDYWTAHEAVDVYLKGTDGITYLTVLQHPISQPISVSDLTLESGTYYLSVVAKNAIAHKKVLVEQNL